ncbi:unnamed protein product, partial [Rotaria magnacalcarata]
VQLIIKGGSQMAGTTIEWSTNNTDVLDLEINNIFKTKAIGHAIVRAKSIGFDPLLGQVRIRSTAFELVLSGLI